MHNTISESLAWRYATKTFIPGKRITDADREPIIESARMAPTAYGLQPFRLVHVTSPEVRARLRTEVGFNQAQITDAGDLYVIARRTDIDTAFIEEYVERTAAVRGMKREDLQGFEAMMKGDILARSEEARATWAGRQAYIALGNMLLTAALLRVDACPMEGFDPAGVDALLGLSDSHLASVGLIALGYRGEGDMFVTLPKVRVAREDLVVVK